MFPASSYLRSSDAQLGTPYLRSAGFDTDVGAFIESSVVSSPEGSMAPSVIYKNAALREVFLPGQIFVFGGFALQANSLGQLEQIDSYAPDHQISFVNRDYVADIRGDLIFQGFVTPSSALALDLAHVSRSEDGIPETAGLFAAIKPSTGEPEEIVSPKD